jgi:organic hydroperoxide reductase OsmC/OhrA
MHPLPHRYVTSAAGGPAGSIAVSSAGLPDLATAAPVEFGGPGDLWSPEALLCASVADCFVLTFRALASAAKLEWSRLDVRVEAVLDRADGLTQFTRFVTRARLVASLAADEAKTHALLEKAEARCLVANSLKGERELAVEIVRGG